MWSRRRFSVDSITTIASRDEQREAISKCVWSYCGLQVGLVGMGAALGLAFGGMTTRALRSLLFEVQPLDPVSLSIAMCLQLAVAGLALHLPVRQAARIDPASMLRTE